MPSVLGSRFSDFITNVLEHGNVRERETEAARSPLSVPSVYLVLVISLQFTVYIIEFIKVLRND